MNISVYKPLEYSELPEETESRIDTYRKYEFERPQGITEFQWIGMLLEMAIDRALSILHIPHRSNHFDKRYAEESSQGIDLTIPTEQGLIGGEAKNHQEKEQMVQDLAKRRGA